MHSLCCRHASRDSVTKTMNHGFRTIAAMLQTSVLAPHLAPSMTSGDRYCLVWMSFVKWWLTQQALPKSAIFTLMTSRPKVLSSAFLFSPVEDDDVLEDLSRETPDTSFARRSLELVVSHLDVLVAYPLVL